MIRGDYAPKTCREFAMRRLTWRVQYDLVDPARRDEALWLLYAIVLLGMRLRA